MTVKALLDAIRGAWWLAVVGLVVGGCSALAVSLIQTPLYTSSTQFFVRTQDAASTADVFQGGQFSQQRVTSYVQLLTGDALAGRVINRLGLDMTKAQLLGEISASTGTDSVLINIRVSDPSPERAQRIAETMGLEFVEFAKELEGAEASGSSPVVVKVTDQPEVADSPSSPAIPRNLAVGLIVGLLTGAAIAVVRARFDRSVKDPEDVIALTGAAVIGTVLRDDVLETRHTIDRSSSNRTAEDYRQLRNNLQFLNIDEPPKVIMVSSALPSEGKTTLVVNLALALADSGQRVTVVEADLRKPKVTRYLGMVGGVGLTNVLAGTAELADVAQRYGDGDVRVLAAGPTPPNPGELLASSHMFSLLEALRADNDFVLVDAPPLLPVADATGLAVFMDGVVLSVRYGSTRKDQLQAAAAASTLR